MFSLSLGMCPQQPPPARRSGSALFGEEKHDFLKSPLYAPVEFGVKLQGDLGSVLGRIVPRPQIHLGNPNSPAPFSVTVFGDEPSQRR